ncbi:MAG: ATP-binding protein [Magnetococcales bacterium]|nr:ATP-binding protein [Magnetococcales bacterium]
MLEISRDEIKAHIKRDNPWWDSETPKQIISPIKYRAYFNSFCQLALNWDIHRSVILMGPRRVGKTVMLQQFIQRCLKDGFHPKNILFSSLDTPLYTGLRLDQIIALFAEITKSNPDEKRIIIFDEIQYFKNWEVHLKVLTDQQPNTRFIASGSAAAALKLQSQESGAGRFTDFYLPPLTFAEFLDFRGLEDELIEDISSDTTINFNTNDITRLNEEFINYLNFGGYPEAVLSKEIQGNIPRYLGRDIIDKVLLRDLPGLYGINNTQELNQLFTTLAYHTGNEINLEGLYNNSGVAKNTISKYLEYLEAAFLIIKVRKIKENGASFKKLRHFKIYLTNPSMRAAHFGPLVAGKDDATIGRMAETAIYSQWLHSSNSLRNIHYARWKSGRTDLEVDLVGLDPGTLKPQWAHEIKWSDGSIDNANKLRGLIQFAKQNNIKKVWASTKTITKESTHEGIIVSHNPCSFQCYMIGHNITKGQTP